MATQKIFANADTEKMMEKAQVELLTPKRSLTTGGPASSKAEKL